MWSYHCHRGWTRTGPELVWCDAGIWRYGEDNEHPRCVSECRDNNDLCTLISAEAGCDEAAVDRLEASVASVSRREPGLVTFTCAGAGGHEGSLHCNGSHWTGDTQICRGDYLMKTVFLVLTSNTLIFI